jgi:hypothetical protein
MVACFAWILGGKAKINTSPDAVLAGAVIAFRALDESPSYATGQSAERGECPLPPAFFPKLWAQVQSIGNWMVGPLRSLNCFN